MELGFTYTDMQLWQFCSCGLWQEEKHRFLLFFFNLASQNHVKVIGE